jgi:ketosteroid isomerase-like protein/catechol 2,3-dioxygenase-like lactoylglutathione lyase family enzyme
VSTKVELVRCAFDAFRGRDAATLAGLLDADVEWLGADAGPWDRHGREQVLEALAALDPRDAGPDERILEAGDRVVLLARGVHTDDGEHRGAACLVIGFAGDRIAHVREYRSSGEALVAAGLEPPDLPTPIAPGDPHPTWAGAAPAADVNGLVPFAHATDVARSIAFYALLGFRVTNTFEPHGSIAWAWLTSGKAQLMLAASDEAIDRAAQGVLFYLYTDDLAALHARLAGAGVRVGEIVDGSPGPRHEISVADPDGYRLMIAQLIVEPAST